MNGRDALAHDHLRLIAALGRADDLGVDPESWEPLSIDWERDGPE